MLWKNLFCTDKPRKFCISAMYPLRRWFKRMIRKWKAKYIWASTLYRHPSNNSYFSFRSQTEGLCFVWRITLFQYIEWAFFRSAISADRRNLNCQPPQPPPSWHEHSETLLGASAAVFHSCHWFVSAMPRLFCHNITLVNVPTKGPSYWSVLVTPSLLCLFRGRGVLHVSSQRDAERGEWKEERLVPCRVRSLWLPQDTISN